MIDSGEIRKGITIELDGGLYRVVEFQHLKLGRGSAQIRLRLKGVLDKHVVERTFQSSERFVPARLEHHQVQFLYEENGLYYFMDQESYEQMTLSRDHVEEAAPFLKDGMELQVLTYKDRTVGVELPVAVTLEVLETSSGFKGDTASSGTKPAKLETGHTVQVPMFINPGDKVKVDTRSGGYLERVT